MPPRCANNLYYYLIYIRLPNGGNKTIKKSKEMDVTNVRITDTSEKGSVIHEWRWDHDACWGLATVYLMMNDAL